MTLWPPVDLTGAMTLHAGRAFAKLGDHELAGVAHTTAMMGHPNPAVALCNLAEERQRDVLVVGTHGRSGLQRLLLGSVAERVIRHAPCAVLAMRNGDDAARFPSNIVVCTDFSPAAKAGIDLAACLAAALGSRVTLLNVQDRKLWRHATDVAALPTTADLEGQLKKMLHDTSRECFATETETSLVFADSVPDGIVETATELGADLIVVATHGRTGIARFVIGSVAERVTRHAPCSVLVARSNVSSFATGLV